MSAGNGKFPHLFLRGGSGKSASHYVVLMTHDAADGSKMREVDCTGCYGYSENAGKLTLVGTDAAIDAFVFGKDENRWRLSAERTSDGEKQYYCPHCFRDFDRLRVITDWEE